MLAAALEDSGASWAAAPVASKATTSRFGFAPSAPAAPPSTLAATHDGSHLTGAALLPYLEQFSGVNVAAPTFQNVGAATPGGGDAPWDPNGAGFGVDARATGFSSGFDIGGGLSEFLRAIGVAVSTPDFNAFYSGPQANPALQWGGEGEAATIAGTFDTAGATRAYAEEQRVAALQNGLDPTKRYVYAARRENPTSVLGSNDTVKVLYQVDDFGTARAISAVNTHEGSSWVDFWKPALINGASIVGASFGLAAAYGAVGGAAAATVDAAPAVASDPLGAYLATGASDGSTIGGFGGYAGAVGVNAAPELLTVAIPGSSVATIDASLGSSSSSAWQPPPSVANDPVGAYLQTGASDASSLSGSGGYAGAITGAPEVLSVAVPGFSVSTLATAAIDAAPSSAASTASTAAPPAAGTTAAAAAAPPAAGSLASLFAPGGTLATAGQLAGLVGTVSGLVSQLTGGAVGGPTPGQGQQSQAGAAAAAAAQRSNLLLIAGGVVVLALVLRK